MEPKAQKKSLSQTDDLRIREIKELAPPSQVIRDFPISASAAEVVSTTRQAIHRIIHEMDDRLLVIIGPCSIHDPKAALEYATRLAAQRQHYARDLEIVMRVYFEKPRGLKTARQVLLNINELGLPAGTEFLDMISPQYIADLVSWGAIGARTTESQVHRELASGLSCPVGFKNGTDGNLRIALDAIKAAAHPHHFLSVTKGGVSAIVSTGGNEDCHVILRGGKAPNYDAASVEAACKESTTANIACRLMVDMSHANSSKKPENQLPVSQNIAAQVAGGEQRIFGVMVESHLVGGRQDLVPGQPLTYGQSITDGCIDWDQSLQILETLANSVRARRLALADNA
jgi:3-deoxy-7-phosphoheptulonate synthase